MKKCIKRNKFQKPIKAQKQDRNRIYAWILLVFMVFWTIAGTLGAIAFFRDKKDDNGLITASADTPSVYSVFYGVCPQSYSLLLEFLDGDSPENHSYSLIFNQGFGIRADSSSVKVLFPTFHNGSFTNAVMSPEGSAVLSVYFLSGGFLSHEKVAHLISTFGSYIPSTGGLLATGALVGYDLSYDIISSSEDPTQKAVCIRVLADFVFGSSHRYVGYVLRVSPFYAFSSDTSTYRLSTLSYSNLSSGLPLVVPRVDSSVDPNSVYVPGLYIPFSALPNSEYIRETYFYGGYVSGNIDGYNDGVEDGRSFGYSDGYDVGYGEGYNVGLGEGGDGGSYEDGYAFGYKRGEYYGYIQGVADSNQYTFKGFLTALIDAPLNSFVSLFNFELLGYNLSSFFLSILTFCLVICIVKLLL